MNKKFHILSSIGVVLFFTGIVFVFIKAWVGVILIATTFAINIYLKIKFPDEFKKITESSKTPQSVKTFKVKHIEGLKFFDNNSEISVSMPGDSILFCNKSQSSEIKFSEIEHAGILEETERQQQNKSVIARAIVGGLLVNPAGAIVGGLSALNPSFKENKRYFLEIKTKSGADVIIESMPKILTKIKDVILQNV